MHSECCSARTSSGTGKLQHLEENAEAAALELSAADLAALD